MDEQPKQPISETQAPIPMSPGVVERVGHEGVCVAWMFVEPLGAWRGVRVTGRRTSADWAVRTRWLVDHPRFAGAERITLACGNLNTHDIAAPCTTRSLPTRRGASLGGWTWSSPRRTAAG